MKNLLRYSLLTFLIFALFTLTGCENGDNGNGADKTVLLTAHIWKFDKLSTTSTDPEIQMSANFLSAFFTNSTLNFAADDTYTWTIMDMPTSGTWEWNADKTKITLDKGTEDEAVQTISTLTSDVLEVIETGMLEDIGNVDVTMRWVK